MAEPIDITKMEPYTEVLVTPNTPAEKERVLVTVTWEETIVKTATFDVTDYRRSYGWDLHSIVTQCQPIVPEWKRPLFGSGVEVHSRSTYILNSQGRLPY